MTSIVRRASPSQRQIIRMVAGAALNAMHSHPDWLFDPRLVMSIAKRAAGTLSASAGVLAVPTEASSEAARASAGHAPLTGAGSTATAPGERAAPSLQRRRASLRYLHNAVGNMAGDARIAGQYEQHAALVAVLRLIAPLLTDEPPRTKRARKRLMKND